MQNFRNLKVWEKAHKLTLSAYQVTATFPKYELYGLSSQLRRACASIAANIAEGCGRQSDPEMARFLLAMGSACEAEYHLLLARDLTFLPTSEYQALNAQVVEVKKILASFVSRLRAES
jgi:four helix bundle protein